nr:PREDICTED: uncharacterized protein LOC109042634 [Bemisia tabaci]
MTFRMLRIMHFPPFFVLKIGTGSLICIALLTSCFNLNREVVAANKPSGILNVLQGRSCKLFNEYAELVRAIPEYEVKLIEVVKYNKTLPVLNFQFILHDQSVMSYKLWVDGYQKYGMEHIYKRSALALHTTVCDSVSGSFFFTNALRNFTNLPSKCPLKVGHLYYVRRFYFNEKSTPPTFPGYKWRFDVQIGPEGSRDTNRSSLYRFYLRVEWHDRGATS